jgi:hypothetical protein
MRPEIKASLDRYGKKKTETGGFLRSVLENDLMGAVGRADYGNMGDLFEICNYVWNKLPATCHGSKKIVKEWLGEE